MSERITKLDSEEVLEVSGGFEEFETSWARDMDPIDIVSGKKKKLLVSEEDEEKEEES